jgi:diguanylate cyclase (GGDEF)-like protein
MTELLKASLPVEPDLQNFAGLVLGAAARLGANRFTAALGLLDIMDSLRADGAGTGYPLSVRLVLSEGELAVQWADRKTALLARLSDPPATEAIAALREELQRSTEATDPALLLRRNAEMARYLDETRVRMESELQAMQRTLEERQRELSDSMRKVESDPLTGLLNRRAFDERLEQAFRRTLRQRGETLSLVLLDLDFFKEINDRFGHQYGDEYLKNMADTMRTAIRADVDLAFRFGGDEFALLLFADRTPSCKRAMKVLKAMNSRVSIGIATINGHAPVDSDVDSFFRRADESLYRAKRAGRGRIFVDGCEQMPEDGCDTSRCAA